MPKLKNTSEISAKQARAIAALLTNPDINTAAADIGCNVRTLYEWLRQDVFRKALREAQAAVIEQAQGRLIAGQSAALDALEFLIRGAESEAVRRQAAMDWVNLMQRYRELGDIETRLLALENRSEK